MDCRVISAFTRVFDALCPAMTTQCTVKVPAGFSLRAAMIGVISKRFSACSLRLAAQDVALSRRKQGFESPRERQSTQILDRNRPYLVKCTEL